MKKHKLFSVTALLIMLFGCTNFIQSESNSSLAEATTTNKASELETNNTNTTKSAFQVKQNKVERDGWELTVTNVRYAGQKYETEYSSYEAVDTWTIVSINIKNTSGKRQRDDDAWFSFLFTELVDSKGKKHDSKERNYKFNGDLSKPFTPGEVRSVDLLFDTPKNTVAKQILIGTDGFDQITLKLP
ncbi:hypothetical protein NIES4071_69450 [Calothrix sp. NIES-4071]|nr:hypothetical protein NIES4071_69450 [Calothrix sp. NIES-4071]BAZ61222.1 hypothetical protein NIES4105_69400 [Calothrix sp. NIES-4105]